VAVQVAEPAVVVDPAQVPVAPLAAPAPAGSALSQLDGQVGDGSPPAAPVSSTLGTSAPASPTLASGLGGGDLVEPRPRPLTYTGPAEDGGTKVQGRGNRGRHASDAAGEAGPARNAPCPCGSGKKYKRCHGAPTTAHS
jgi:preprotein translocase subunit SecA